MAAIDPVLNTCKYYPGQTYRVVFQKVFLTGSTKNGVAVADAVTLSNWSTLATSATESHTVITDKVGGGKVTPGAVKEFGGGNETPGGSPIPMGKGTSKFEGKMFQTIQTAIAELKKLENVAGLGVYFVSHNDQVTGRLETIATVPTMIPIPIEQFPYFQDAEFGELENPVSNTFGFYLPENWSDALTTVTCPGIKDLINS